MFLPLHIMLSARTGHLVGLFLASWMPIDADDAHTDFFDIWGTWFDDARALCYARLACRWWWRIFLVPPNLNDMYRSHLCHFNMHLRHIYHLDFDSDEQ